MVYRQYEHIYWNDSMNYELRVALLTQKCKGFYHLNEITKNWFYQTMLLKYICRHLIVKGSYFSLFYFPLNT